MKSPGVVAVVCVVLSGLVLDRRITSCTFSPWTEMSKKNGYVYRYARGLPRGLKTLEGV